MASADQRKLVELARKGKLEGDDGFRSKLTDFLKSEMSKVGEGVDFKEKPYFRSALWEASWRAKEGKETDPFKPQHFAILKLLAEKKADIQHQDYQGRTPLHECAFYGYTDRVQFLVDQGHPLDCLDEFGQTPLFRACEGARVETIEYLLKKGASTTFVDSDGVSAAHLLGFQGQGENSDYLLYNGAWKNRFQIEQPGPPPPLKRDFSGVTIPVAEGAPSPRAPSDAAETKEAGV